MPFIHLSFHDKRVATYELGGDDLTIGRTPNNDIAIDNPGVSSYHAVIRKLGDDYVLEDLKSKNGTFIKGNKVQKHRLEYGDVITIFKHQLRFVPLAVGNIAPPGQGWGGGPINQNQTIKVDIARQLESMNRPAPNHVLARLTAIGEDGKKHLFPLSDEDYGIGRSDQCLVKTKGIMAPPISAWLNLRDGAYLLSPARRGEVVLNSLPLEMPQLLEDGDRIEIRRLLLLYQTTTSATN